MQLMQKRLQQVLTGLLGQAGATTAEEEDGECRTRLEADDLGAT
jgi:hypothetical protein